MHSATVFAVVVTYNPDKGLQKRLQILRAQVQALLVVDNGSDDAEFIENIARQLDCQVILNAKNLGIAEALNQGARIAVQQGAAWLATFDQDSQTPSDGIATLLAAASCLHHADRVAIVAMSHRDSATGRDYHRRGEILEEHGQWRRLRTTITSGSLIKISTFAKVGMFDSRLFIDMVDIDFCMRCRQHNLLVMENRTVTLSHSLGNSTLQKVFGWPLVLTHHSPLRRYYMTRNQLEMCLRYVWIDTRWVLGTAWHLLGSSVLVILMEAQRWQKILAIFAGVRDFVLRRFGPKS